MVETARRRDLLSWLTAGLLSASCAECAPGLVGEGVARLTVRNAGAILELVNANDACGFASRPVVENPIIDGQSGFEGTATWTVTDCEIDLGQTMHVKSDCEGVETRIGGKLMVSATRTIGGTLTGDMAQPVIPGGPDAVTLKVNSAAFEDFYVESSDSDAVLTMYSGTISFTAKPRLAVAESNGVCSIPTPNVAFSDVVYERARLHVKTDGHDFDVDVPTSNLWAVNGRHGAAENDISGVITVWTSNVTVESGDDGLNPEYDPAKFHEGFACTEDLAEPLSFECIGVGPRLAQGAARLAVRTFGTIVSILDDDTACGFSSQAARGPGTTLLGGVGNMGAAETRVESCVLQFGPDSAVKSDCNGLETFVSGKVTVSAVRRLEGRLTGDPAEPVVPMTDTPARVEVTGMIFEDFEVKSEGTALRLLSGGMTGVLIPRVAVDDTRGACSVKTPIARFANLAFADARVALTSPSGQFETSIEHSNLSALNGNWGAEANLLAGRIVLGGETFDLPTDPNDDGLDPEYDQEKFDASWKPCAPAKMPISYDCHFVRPIAQGAAQLTAMTFGSLSKLLEADNRCGFASPPVQAGVAAIGDLGEPGGSATFTVSEPCEIHLAPRTVLETDCNGVKTYAQGIARLVGTKSIRGYVSGHPVDAAVPVTRDAVDVTVAAELRDFEIWREPGEHSLTVRSGVLSGTVHPRLAINTVRGACSVPTPVATLEDLVWQESDLVVKSEGKTFGIHVAESDLDAQNGSKDGVENRLSGRMVVDGEEVVIPVDGNPILDPDFDQARFDASWACTANMRVPANDADCLQALKKTMGEGAARLIVQTLGTVTKMVNSDDDCGFESNLTDPDRVIGDPGEMGQMEWSVQNCQLQRDPNRVFEPISTDCTEIGTFTEGGVSVNGRRTVRGLREDITFLFLRFHSISPKTRESVEVGLDQVVFDHFKAYERPMTQQVPRRSLTIHSGTLSARVQPILGENRRSRGTFDIPTPLARLSDITLTNAPVTIFNEGMTLKARVEATRLDAFNGSYRGERNTIRGHIIIDGQRIDMPPQDLDPEYDQAAFDRRYACTDDLRGTVPPSGP